MKKTIRAGLIRSVLIVVAPLIILLVTVNIFSWETMSLCSEESVKSALKIQAFSVNDMFSETEKSVNGIITNNLQDLLVIQREVSDLSDFLSKQAVFNRMKNYTATTETKDALFLYSLGDEYLLLNSPEIVGSQRAELSKKIKVIFKNEEFVKARWHLQEIDGEIYAFMWRRVNSFYVGGIIPMGEMAEMVLEESEDILQHSNVFFADTSLCVSVLNDGTVVETKDRLETPFLFSQAIESADIRIYLAYRGFPFLVSPGIPMMLAVLLSLASLLSMPVLIGKISNRFIRPFQDIQQGMRLVQQGGFQTQIEETFPYRETEDMRLAFNEMVKQIRVLKNDIYEEKILREKTEANFYQLQVKPHFYLNSLNQIHILAQMGDLEGISQSILQLIEYFRYLLRSNEQTVMLRDELKHIQNFLVIQKRKYPIGFEFKIDMPPKMLELQIPPLLLLTFFENSIKYASGVYNKLELLLSGEEIEGSGWRLILEDNGPGFDEEALSALQEGKKLRASDGHSCIGITNAQQRLRFIYGKDACISFCNGGTLPGAHVEIFIRT